MTGTGEKPRRTNEVRTAEMRARLLDATIDCLYELGYAGMTTTHIAERAGVSRGAQLHHFPTRASLVTTAVEHLFERRHEAFRAAIARVPEGADLMGEAIDLLWPMMTGPTFYAWLELLVAARTDGELLEAVAQTSRRFSAAVRATFIELFPEQEAHAELAVGFVFSLLEGLALREITHPGDARSMAVLSGLKALAQLLGVISGGTLAGLARLPGEV